MKRLRVLHLLALGGAGGIESQCVNVAKYSNDENYFYFLWGGGNNAEAIQKITANIEIRNFKLSHIFSEFRRFLIYCKENEIEYVVCQGISPAMILFINWMRWFLPDKKRIIYLHANAEDLFYNFLPRKLFQHAYKHIDGCIAISHSVSRSMYLVCKDISKIHTIYNGVDTTKFRETVKAKRKLVPTLIYIGRLIPSKGVDLLLRAVKMISKDYELYIIGEGTECEKLKALKESLDLNDRVEFTGVQWNISEWLAKADLFIHPAVWNEGFGLAIVEAMSAGVPCIAFNRGAIPEIITDRKNGFLIENVDAEALAEGINRALDIREYQAEKWQDIRNAAISRALFFDINNYIEQLHEYLMRL